MEGTVNEFIRSKWRQIHRFFDANNDGILTEEDFKSLADILSKKAKSTPEQTAHTREEWLKWFRRFQPEPSIQVDADRVQNLHEELYSADLQKYKTIIRGTTSDLFDRIDLDGDGVIDSKEFNIFYEAFGIKDPELAKRNFSKIDKNGDGKIQREEFIEEVIRHFTDPDPSTEYKMEKMEREPIYFLKFKWRQVHRFLDADKDGVLTEGDFLSIADYLSEKANSTPQQTDYTRKEWVKWFRRLQPDPSIAVDVDRHEALHKELYSKNLEKYKQMIQNTNSDIFVRIDLDGDGFISLEEFCIFYEAVGIRNFKIAHRNFSKIDKNGDGKIQREEYLDELLRHFTDPDRTTGVTYFFETEDKD